MPRRAPSTAPQTSAWSRSGELLARQQALHFDPGDRFSYTNSGYFLLAEIVTRVSGVRASAFARESLFDPLGMTNTRFYDEPNAIIPNQALGYSLTPEGGYRLDILRSDVIGDLGVITTVEDLLHWDNNFYDNKLGGRTNDLIATMFTRGRTEAGEELSYALGLELGTYRGLNTMGHGGSAVGYVAEFLQFPEQRFSVVVLSNLSSFRSGRLARQVADLYLADQFTGPQATGGQAGPRPTAPAGISLSIAELEAFGGDFYSEELDFTYFFDVREGGLHLELRGDRMKLIPYPDDRFGWGRRELSFARDESGAVSGFVLNAGSVQGLRFRKVTGRVP